MAIARAQLVDVSVTRWYHCVTRCVRRAFLLGDGDHNRMEWLENRLEELAEIFAMAVGGFAVMNNHLHLLLRLDPEVAQAWSDSGKTSISAELAEVFVRLGCSAQSWQIQIERLRGARVLGLFFTSSRVKLRQIAEHLGVRRQVNLRGCHI
jgi:Transposase IS200 like